MNDIDSLLEMAVLLGASDARSILSSEIISKDDLAALCDGDPRCKNYGLSMSCPPHVGGPSQFKHWIEKSTHSIVVKIDLPSKIMFSAERREISALLHEMVATIELEAIRKGFVHAKAFAGGSCKPLFCQEHRSCQVIETSGKCRHPDMARPSMSGFGVDVAQLMQSAGWAVNKVLPQKSDDEDAMTWMAGLIVL